MATTNIKDMMITSNQLEEIRFQFIKSSLSLLDELRREIDQIAEIAHREEENVSKISQLQHEYLETAQSFFEECNVPLPSNQSLDHIPIDDLHKIIQDEYFRIKHSTEELESPKSVQEHLYQVSRKNDSLRREESHLKKDEQTLQLKISRLVEKYEIASELVNKNLSESAIQLSRLKVHEEDHVQKTKQSLALLQTQEGQLNSQLTALQRENHELSLLFEEINSCFQ